MSKRFGRNQKRKLKERIAVLDAGIFQCSNTMSSLRRQVRELESELDDAKKLAGEFSILFPAKRLAVSGQSRDVLLEQRQPGQGFGASEGSTYVIPKPLKLNLLLTRVNPEVLGNSLHIKTSYDNTTCGYAISKEAMLQTPKYILVDLVAKEIAKMLVTEIKLKG